MMMDEVRCLTVNDQLVEDAIQQLATGFMSLQEYTIKVSEGSLVKKPIFADDQAGHRASDPSARVRTALYAHSRGRSFT